MIKNSTLINTLEEVASDYGRKANMNGVGGEDYADDMAIAFKAGAEWMMQAMTLKNKKYEHE